MGLSFDEIVEIYYGYIDRDIVNINLDYYKKERYNGKCDKDVLYKLITRTSKKELRKIVDNEKELTNYYNKMNH